MARTKIIYCCGCEQDVHARLTDGQEIYSHRPDLYEKPFWKCDACSNYVGTHWKTKDPTRPLGNIPTAELREARKHIHKILDPIWKSKRLTRRDLYQRIGRELGYEYHTAEIKNIDDARKVYVVVRDIQQQLRRSAVAT